MEIPFFLLCALILVCPVPVTRCENDFKGNGDNGGATDMEIVGSSPSRSNILVHNTFHLPPMDQTFHIPPMDQMRSSEMIDDAPFTDSSMMRQPVNDHYNFQSDGIRLLEGKIDWLVKSNHQILSVLNALEHKINQTFDTTHNFNIRSAKPPSSTIDLMDNLEVMNLLNNIHQFIVTSNSKAKQSDILEAHQIQVIKDFVSAVESERKNTGHATPSTTSSVNQMLANSWKTIQYLEKVSGTVQDIDERTVRMFDKSCRQGQGQKLSYENRYDDCNCDNDMPGGKNRHEHGRYERTYGSMKRDTSRVIFEPNKYNCHDLQIRKNGIYKFASLDEVSNEAGRFLYERYCDFSTDGGAWTVIQRRFMNDQQENFNRSWLDYKLGFGDLDKEFWFGNDFIHKLTFDEDVVLRVVLEDVRGRKGWAEYSLFKVDSEEYNYNLIIGGYRGTIRDGLLYHNDQEFSTYDRQNDNNENSSCASSYGNGWWFNNCTQTINGDYIGITWENWLGSDFLKSSKMMIRPKGLWGGSDSDEEGYIYTSNAMDP